MIEILVGIGQLASGVLLAYGAVLVLDSSESIALLRKEIWERGLLHTPHSHRVDLFGGRHPELEW